MSERTHTQTPWRVSDEAPLYIIGADGKEAALDCGEANAKHIVRCVNSHAALLAACRAAKAHLCFGHRDDWLKVLDQLTAAISEAE